MTTCFTFLDVNITLLTTQPQAVLCLLCLLSMLSLLQALYSKISKDSGREGTVITGNSGVKTLSSEYINVPTHEANNKGEGERGREEGETSQFGLQRDEKLMRWKDAQGCTRQGCRGKSSPPMVGEGNLIVYAVQRVRRVNLES